MRQSWNLGKGCKYFVALTWCVSVERGAGGAGGSENRPWKGGIKTQKISGLACDSSVDSEMEWS